MLLFSNQLNLKLKEPHEQTQQITQPHTEKVANESYFFEEIEDTDKLKTLRFPRQTYTTHFREYSLAAMADSEYIFSLQMVI